MHYEKLLHVIAIPQAGITAPTPTVMQGFEAKKRLIHVTPSLILRTASTLSILPFHAFAPLAGIKTGYNNWKQCFYKRKKVQNFFQHFRTEILRILAFFLLPKTSVFVSRQKP